jgi:hypothetical protein
VTTDPAVTHPSIEERIAAAGRASCTCARSQGLHSKSCTKYVPGHDLASPEAAARRLAEEWGAVSVPLSDAQLAATARRITTAMFAGLMPGETGSNMADQLAERVTAPYIDAVERLRAELAQARTAAITVAEARRDVHESLAGLSAWAADEVREKVARLEHAVERHIREQVATEIETTAEANRQGLLPRPKVGTAEFMNDFEWAAAVARQADDTTSKGN